MTPALTPMNLGRKESESPMYSTGSSAPAPMPTRHVYASMACDSLNSEKTLRHL